MKKLELRLLLGLLFISFITGFFCNHIMFIIGLFIFLCSVTIVLFTKLKPRFDYLTIVISLCGFFVTFHFGLLLRNNLRKVCTNTPPIDKTISNNNIKPLALDEIEQELSTYINLFTKESLVTVNYKNSSFPIKILKPRIKDTNKIKILIIAGTHGSEPAGVYATLEILKKVRNENLLKRFDLNFIYALNPVGLSLFNRFNECNCDINRDYLQFNTIQSDVIRNLCDYYKFDYVLDLHEGAYEGQYVINNTLLSGFKENLINNLNKENINISPMMNNWLQDQLFRYQLDSPINFINKIMPLDNYLNSIGIENILSESNVKSKNMENRILGHVVVFETLIESL